MERDSSEQVSAGVTSTENTERGDFAKVEARLNEIPSMDDLRKMMDERTALESQKNEMVGKAQEEASTEATVRAEQAEQSAIRRQADLAEASRLSAEIKNSFGGGGESAAEAPVAEVAAEGVIGAVAKEELESKPVDVVELNNKIVNLRTEGNKAEAIANMSTEESSAVAKYLLEKSKGDENFDRVQGMLNNFRFNSEIMSQPETQDALKNVLLNSNNHIYDVDRIINMPGFSKETLNDPQVREKVIGSASRFFANNRVSEFEGALRVTGDMGLTSTELRGIADGLKGNTDAFNAFATHFGVKNLYPEVG